MTGDVVVIGAVVDHGNGLELLRRTTSLRSRSRSQASSRGGATPADSGHWRWRRECQRARKRRRKATRSRRGRRRRRRRGAVLEEGACSSGNEAVGGVREERCPAVVFVGGVAATMITAAAAAPAAGARRACLRTRGCCEGRRRGRGGRRRGSRGVTGCTTRPLLREEGLQVQGRLDEPEEGRMLERVRGNIGEPHAVAAAALLLLLG